MITIMFANSLDYNLQLVPVLVLQVARATPQPDEVHLDAQVLHQQLPGHPAHRVEGVVWVGVRGA